MTTFHAACEVCRLVESRGYGNITDRELVNTLSEHKHPEAVSAISIPDLVDLLDALTALGFENFTEVKDLNSQK